MITRYTIKGKNMESTKQTTVKQSASTTAREPRNFLATFLLVVGLGQFGANRIYTGHTTPGYTRLILSIGGILLSPVLIGIPMVLVAQIWGFFDIFAVYHGSRTDADGAKLYENAHDRKVAKIIYIIFIVFLVLTIAFLALIATLITLGIINSDPSELQRINNEVQMQVQTN